VVCLFGIGCCWLLLAAKNHNANLNKKQKYLKFKIDVIGGQIQACPYYEKLSGFNVNLSPTY
jgi:hypothetical protein